jgi:hypothetical protein
VWQVHDGHDYEIFLYNSNTITQLTDNEIDDGPPQIDGGQVVWAGYDGSNWKIFLYDGALPPTLLTTIGPIVWDGVFPQIDGGQVVWQGSEDGQDNEIFFYDGGTIIQLTDNETDDARPQIDGGQVVWIGYDHGNEIFLYNGNTISQLTTNETGDWLPQIDSGQVVWSGPDGQATEGGTGGSDDEIFLATCPQNK